MNLSFVERFERVPTHNLVGPAVPEHDRAAAIFALRNHTLEGVVLHRMIFDLDGEAAGGGIEAGPFGHRPALHDAPELQTEVIVQMTGGVLLDDERESATEARHDHAAPRLRGNAEVALATILGELPSDRGRCRHSVIVRPSCAAHASRGPAARQRPPSRRANGSSPDSGSPGAGPSGPRPASLPAPSAPSLQPSSPSTSP